MTTKDQLRGTPWHDVDHPDEHVAAEGAAHLLTRTAHLMRQHAAAADSDVGGPYWFADQAQNGRCSIIVEHEGCYVIGSAPEPVAQHAARWDPHTAATAAAMLEASARIIRMDGRIGDHAPAVDLARAYMRSYGEPVR
ncbi:hypothetical protein [Jiangella gansuensis]|uniref:hypothetical protein n=1 Tax=Jiangella gansuensis TaxID=281473 RepID=UPI00047DACDD|nr:hypothetical protein [Jiangella gansuensis]